MNQDKAALELSGAGEVLTEHLPCASCAYDLHGLKPSGLCPECGWPIEKTLEAGGLDCKWLVGIHSGVQALLVAHYMLLGSAVLCFLLPMGICFFIILMLGGAVELGTPHPKAPLTDTRCRRPARVIGAGMIAAMLGVILLPGLFEIGAVLIGLGAAAMWTGVVLLWRHFAALMLHRFSAAAGRRGQALAWAHGIIALLAAIAAGLSFWPAPNPAGTGAGTTLAMLAALLGVIAAIGAIITLHSASSALRQALGVSRSLERAAERRGVEEWVRVIR